MPSRSQSLIELNLAVLLWAGTALFAKWIALPAFEITGLRSVVATLVLFVALKTQRQGLGLVDRRDLGILILSGLAMAAHWITYFESIQVSTVAIGILALHTYPVMTAILEPLWFGERLRAMDVAMAGLVLVGVAVLVPEFSLRSRVLQGILWGVVSAALFTVRNLLTRRLGQRYRGSKITYYQLLAAAVALTPIVLAAGRPVPPKAALQLILLGAVFTALPHTLYTNALQHLSARTVAVIATLLPVYGALSAALFLGELPSRRTILGGVIILGTVTAETWRALQRR